jgi:D-alanyl-D-alanine carboxypeptidase (penicillin-binding protein 5/6)
MYNAETLSYETSRYNNNVICFLAKMNTLGKYKVKLYSTNFANPHGLSNTSSLSTAEDMAILTGYALKNSHFRRIV